MASIKNVKTMQALKQLKKEKLLYCKMYKKCNACPNLLEGGYCEIKLAIEACKNIMAKEK